MKRLDDESDFEDFENLNRDYESSGGPRRRYSVTGDILSYRRCARQYGHFDEYEFSPAQAAQLWFGQVIHQTLDRAHRQYKGQIEGMEASIPDEDDIEEYFEQVSESLEAQGITPMSGDSKEKALEYLKEFNEKMADQLYPKVKDTEHRLQRQQEDFVMEGIVDVLVRNDADEEDPENWEIWDYKAQDKPDEGSEDLKNYKYQMRVYAGIFKKKNGSYPSKAVLYFLGEDEPEDAKLEIRFNENSIQTAVNTFQRTVEKIQDSRERDSWDVPDHKPSEETCDACDIRWDCPLMGHKYERRNP